MIDVAAVLRELPRFTSFCSVAQLHALVEELSADSRRFSVTVAGRSPKGVPIYHVRAGAGSVKVLLVGFPHPNEPIGGLTSFGLLTLLARGQQELLRADVEWHIVPCIDPDGARLNEGWSLQPFTLDAYMRNSHRQELRDQVDCTFPLEYKRLRFDRPTPEAKVLLELLARIRPDFYYSLHNTSVGGGVWYSMSRRMPQQYYTHLYDLLRQHHLPLRTSQPIGEWCQQFADGVFENYTTTKVYDYLECTTPEPEKLIQHGECSWDFLVRIKPDTLTMVTELPYAKHPMHTSTAATAQASRQLRLQVDAESKFVATVILEEWDRVAADLDGSSAFHRKIRHSLVDVREQLHEGLPSWPHKSREVLMNPAYNKIMTQGERFSVYIERFFLLCHNYEFVRLLRESKQSEKVRAAIARLEQVFDAALADISRNVDLAAFEVVDCGTLAKVQLGSGLIALNSLLAQRRSAHCLHS